MTLPRPGNRIPTPAASTSQTFLTFPNDLVTVSRNFYMAFGLCTYSAQSVLSGAQLIPTTTISLPIPIKLNDQTTINWEQASLTSLGVGVAANIINSLGNVGKKITSVLKSASDAASAVSGALTGKAPNPFMVMLFKSQNFKEHTFQWILSPNNQKEAQDLQSIIEYFKAALLPKESFGGLTLDYPLIAQIAINLPQSSGNSYLYKFKPSAIVSFMADWTAGPNPAFHTDGAPAIVSITMQIKEIELWFRTDNGKYA